MKNQKKKLLKKLRREPEYYENFLRGFGASSLLPNPVREVASKCRAVASKTTGTTAEAAITVAAVSGFAGAKAIKSLVLWAKPRSELSQYFLIKALFVSSDLLPKLRLEVQSLLEKAAKKFPDESSLFHASIVTSKLITKSMIRTGALGGLTSVPGTVPGIGTMGTVVLMFSWDFFYLLRTQFLLCYGIAMAHRVDFKETRLRAICLSLMEFSEAAGKEKKAPEAFRQIIEKTVDAYTSVGLNKSFNAFLERVSLKSSGRYLRIVPFLGIPIGMLANVQSTSAFGEKARIYFENC